jgi:2-polyprenyl-6-methoxyphenol hydroxylase-like FAD-dependent oxidoreductase
MVFSFGGNGFFGYSSGGPPTSQQLMWWSTFETTHLPDITAIDPQVIKTALLKRHKNWHDPILQDIIHKAEVKSVYPTWTLPELPHWGERGVVLVGDAAHAMDPTTGQGASQALEDAQTLALVLGGLEQGGNMDSQHVDIGINLFHKIRAPRVAAIVERGKKIAGRKANVGVVKEYFMYYFLWLMIRFPAIGKCVIWHAGWMDRGADCVR